MSNSNANIFDYELSNSHANLYGLCSPGAPFSLELFDPNLYLKLFDFKHHLLTCEVQQSMVILSLLYYPTLKLLIWVYHNLFHLKHVIVLDDKGKKFVMKSTSSR